MMATFRDRDIKHLSPEMQVLAARFLLECRKRGVDVLIYHTHRTDEEQAEAWAQGRTKSGPKITWTRISKHQRNDPITGEPASDAFDGVPRIKGVPDWNARKEFLIMGQVAKEIGLRWGANWDQDDKPFEPGETDSPHFELVRDDR